MQTTFRVRARRTAVAALALSLGATGLLVSGAGAAGETTPPPTDVMGSAYAYDVGVAGYGIGWDVPESTRVEGTTLAGYEATLYTGEPAYTTVVARSTTTAVGAGYFDFTDLTIGQRYQAAVRAIYTVDQPGEAPDETVYSIAVNGDKTRALNPPPAPRSLSAKATARGVVTVRWAHPSIPPLTDGVGGYNVSASPEMDFDDLFSGDAQFESISTSTDRGATSAKLRNLRPGVTYDVRVDTYGDGIDLGMPSFGAGVQTSVTAITTPSAPSKVAAKSLTRGRAKVSWKAKATKAAPIKGFKVYVNGKLKKTTGKSARSFVVKGQKAGKTYRYSVRAINAVGTSAPGKLTKKRARS